VGRSVLSRASPEQALSVTSVCHCHCSKRSGPGATLTHLNTSSGTKEQTANCTVSMCTTAPHHTCTTWPSEMHIKRAQDSSLSVSRHLPCSNAQKPIGVAYMLMCSNVLHVVARNHSTVTMYAWLTKCAHIRSMNVVTTPIQCTVLASQLCVFAGMHCGVGCHSVEGGGLRLVPDEAGGGARLRLVPEHHSFIGMPLPLLMRNTC
jgi:hypothetical protein